MKTKKWQLLFYKAAQKDAKKVESAGLVDNLNKILDLLEEDPFKTPPSYEKLVGNLAGCYSRRINIQHRIVYEVDIVKREVKIYRMFGHYD